MKANKKLTPQEDSYHRLTLARAGRVESGVARVLNEVPTLGELADGSWRRRLAGIPWSLAEDARKAVEALLAVHGEEYVLSDEAGSPRTLRDWSDEVERMEAQLAPLRALLEVWRRMEPEVLRPQLAIEARIEARNAQSAAERERARAAERLARAKAAKAAADAALAEAEAQVA